MNLILVSENDFDSENIVTLTDNRAGHIREILRAQVNDTLTIGLLTQKIGTAKIHELNPNKVSLSIMEWREPILPGYHIDLICALPRPQTVKKILFIAGMMGIRHVYFIRANRVEKSYYDSPLLCDEQMRPHLYEGMMQGKNVMLPDVSLHTKFRPFFEDIVPNRYPDKTNVTMILPHMNSDNTIASCLSAESNEYLLAIGPEGGWVDFEIDLMTKLGFQPVTLSEFTLRVEHAVTAAISQIELTNMIKKDNI